MPINVQCTSCASKFRAPDELAGKQVKCPKCLAIIHVNKAEQQHKVQPPVAVMKPSQPSPIIMAKSADISEGDPSHVFVWALVGGSVIALILIIGLLSLINAIKSPPEDISDTTAVLAASETSTKPKGQNELKLDQSSDSEREVDIETFLKAYNQGKVDKYKGFIVNGYGPPEPKECKCIFPDGHEEYFYEVTPFVVQNDGTFQVIHSWKESLDAQVKEVKRLTILLYGNDIKKLPENFNGELIFSGRFDGKYEGVTDSFSRGPTTMAAKREAPMLVNCTISIK